MMNLNSMQHALQTLCRRTRMASRSLPRHLVDIPGLFRFRYLPILVLTGGLSQPLQAADIKVSVENIQELTGTLFWSIFDSEESYASDSSPLLAGRSRVISDTIKVTLHELPSGSYAVKLFHDANDNGEMDSNLLGLPQEGYGFSNNAGRFGPASFADAKVEVKEDTLISIRLR